MYGKIYEQTFTGSMLGSGSCVFAVWSYVIAHTKPDAMVELNPIAIACVLGEDVRTVERAITHFLSPDSKSRSKEFDGCRLIQKGEFIYFVPQYHKYHGFANDRERREYFAQKKREQRQRDTQRQTVKSKVSNNVQQSESEAKAQSKTKTNSNNGEQEVGFLEQLKHDPLFTGINIDLELEKAQRWCRNKDRRLTERFFKNWLTKADRVIAVPKPTPVKQPEFRPALTSEEIERNRKFAAEMVRKVRKTI